MQRLLKTKTTRIWSTNYFLGVPLLLLFILFFLTFYLVCGGGTDPLSPFLCAFDDILVCVNLPHKTYLWKSLRCKILIISLRGKSLIYQSAAVVGIITRYHISMENIFRSVDETKHSKNKTLFTEVVKVLRK